MVYKDNSILLGDIFKIAPELPQDKFDLIVTSPPFWNLRDYDHEDQFGLELDFKDYVTKLCNVIEIMKPSLKPEGLLWLNLGDTYIDKNRLGLKRKSLAGIPWRVAIQLMDLGWILREEIIWNKPNLKPSPVKDRCNRSHEQLFVFSKNPKYYYDKIAISEKVNPLDNSESPLLKGKNSVWNINKASYRGKHTATFPTDLIEPIVKASTCEKGNCINCGTPYSRISIDSGARRPVENYKGQATKDYSKAKAENPSDVKRRILYYQSIIWDYKFIKKCNCETDEVTPPIIFDPFMGAGTVGLVAKKLGRTYFGVEINPENKKEAEARIKNGRNNT